MTAATINAKIMIPLSKEKPPFDENVRVLVYTEGHDFNGEQFFDIKADDLHRGIDESGNEVAALATHWMPLPFPSAEAATPSNLTDIEQLKRKYRQIITAATSLGENGVWALASELADIAAQFSASKSQNVVPKYWSDGTAIIERCLTEASEAKHENAPFPLDHEQAALWHQAQVDAYRHALEMMGVPSTLSPAQDNKEDLKPVKAAAKPHQHPTKLFAQWMSLNGESCEWIGGDQFKGTIQQGKYEAFYAGMEAVVVPTVQAQQPEVRCYLMIDGDDHETNGIDEFSGGRSGGIALVSLPDAVSYAEKAVTKALFKQNETINKLIAAQVDPATDGAAIEANPVAYISAESMGVLRNLMERTENSSTSIQVHNRSDQWHGHTSALYGAAKPAAGV